MNVDLAGSSRVTHELDATRAVDEVEEDELPHLTSRHDATGKPEDLIELAPWFERLRRGTSVRDFGSIRESLGRSHERAA